MTTSEDIENVAEEPKFETVVEFLELLIGEIGNLLWITSCIISIDCIREEASEGIFL